ncbi:MAG: relaxase/mobilization nuclease domain-containing protein, partial [Christensenella sp.]
ALFCFGKEVCYVVAYTKIRNINSIAHLTDAVNYAANIGKTLETLTNYVENEKKTVDGARFVSAINCCPETAARAMMATKRRFQKEDGRIAYHIIQSFMPGEIAPELAHKIGKQYAERWLGDFEVVIGTHLDQKHIHNHLIINSVSCVTGKKFHISRGDFYKKLRGISDDLCRENGLSVIEYADGKNMTYEEYLRRHSGGRTLHGIMKDDMETCIGKSFSLGEFFMRMEDLGYEIDTSVMHPKVKAPEARRFTRIERLGYSMEELKVRILNQKRREYAQNPKRYYCKHRFPRKRLTSIEALYLYYLFILGKVRQSPQTAPLPISEYRKFYEYKRLFHFIAKNGFEKISDVEKTLEVVKQQLEQLKRGKYELRDICRKNKSLFDAQSVVERYSEISDKLDEERRLVFHEAKEIIRKSGYENNLEAIKEMRAALINSMTTNKTEEMRLKRAKRSLEDVLRCSQKMKEHLAVRERSKEKLPSADEPER